LGRHSDQSITDSDLGADASVVVTVCRDGEQTSSSLIGE